MADKLEILLVDDEVQVQRALRRTLDSIISANIDTASSGEEGLEKCHDKSYDIIISDLTMTGMEGTEFLRHVS